MAASTLPKPSSRMSRSSMMMTSSRRPSTQRPYHRGVENDHHDSTTASVGRASKVASRTARPPVSADASSSA